MADELPPRGDDPVAEIIEGRLWQSGSRTTLEDIQRRRINAVIAVGHEEQPWLEEWEAALWLDFEPTKQNRQAAYVRIPLFDASHCLDAEACDAAIVAALTLLCDQERRLLVHCDAGAFRSVHVSACLYGIRSGVGYVEAFRHCDRARGHAQRNGIGLSGWQEHGEAKCMPLDRSRHPRPASLQEAQAE